MTCRKCGESLDRLLIYAVLKDLGCFVSAPAERCHGGEEHEFPEEDK